jgi:hypothetical protein
MLRKQSISLGGYNVLTNVGASYDAIAASRGLGIALIDFTGVISITAVVGVNKIGSGTQSWQLWNETDGAEIGVLDDAGATGNKTLSGTISNNLPSGEKLVRIRCKSTVAADDPVFYGATLLLVHAAASFERDELMNQVLLNLARMPANYRDNAAGYKTQVNANRPAAEIAAVMVADANAFLSRLALITDLATRNLPLLTASLEERGYTLVQATGLRDTLVAAANHVKAATLTTGQQITTEADWLLANVPAYERLW